MDRVGDYVRRALPKAMLDRGIDWPCWATYNEGEVRGFLSRGELVLDTFHRRLQWWIPTSREKGDRIVEDLADTLEKMVRHQYGAADSTGRIVLAYWRDDRGDLHPERQETGRPVTLTMEPGVRSGGMGAQGLARFAKHREHVTLTLDQAEEAGWLRIE